MLDGSTSAFVQYRGLAGTRDPKYGRPVEMDSDGEKCGLDTITYFLDSVNPNVISRGQFRREISNLLQRCGEIVAQTVQSLYSVSDSRNRS